MAITHSSSIVEIAALRHAVRGSVLAPGDEGWDEARTPWNVAFEQHPALIVEPANSADVQATIRFALANGLRVAPQGTGHGVATLGDVSDAVLVRMHKLRHVESLKLYPVIARGLSPDPIARRLFWQSRLVTLGLARRVLRRLDELARAVRTRSEVAAAAEHAANALLEYRRRNESTMFPLYTAVGRRLAPAKSKVA